MASLPEATLRIQEDASAFGVGVDLITLFMTVARNADGVPRLFGSTDALLEKHSYSPGVGYAALHIARTRKPVQVVPIAAAVDGSIYQLDTSLVTGTSVVTVAAGDDGVQEVIDGIVTVTKGGTIGTDPILLSASMDGGFTTKTFRVGLGNSYVIPYLGIELQFGAGTLVEGDAFTFRTTAPIWDQAGIQAGRIELADQQVLQRSWLVIGNLETEQNATDILTEANLYETANERDIYCRTQAGDHYAPALMVGGPTLTFAENTPAADTITRSAGSFITDGFRAGMTITVSGTASNDGTYTIASLVALTLTLEASDDLVAEAAVADVVLTGVESLNTWAARISAVFDDIDSQKRIDIAGGYGRERCPITGWLFRRPAAWGVSIREYQHDVQKPTYRKDFGPLVTFDLEDADGDVVEYDDRKSKALTLGRFTCFRTYANGPRGTFVALSQTRAGDDSIFSRTHNLAVVNVACSTIRRVTEDFIGVDLVLNADGTATEESLQALETRVNSALQIAVLQAGSEGQRASGATWEASRSDVLNVPGATLHGSAAILLNGTIEKVDTVVRVQTAG